MKKLPIKLSALVLTLVMAIPAMAAKSVPVNIKEGEKTFEGKLFFPESAAEKKHGELPLVAVVHEWWGLTEHPEQRAERIADELGYAALAVDLYGGQKTASNPKDAQELATPFYQNPMMAVKRMQAFIAAAPKAAREAGINIDNRNIASIGFCFGGTQSLNLARAGKLPGDQKLVGVVSFHGGLASNIKAKRPMAAKVLVLHGADDKMVSDKDVAAYKKEMKAAKASLEFHSYPGAMHAFTNPKATEVGQKFQIPVAYNEKADKDSWEQMKNFLKKIFKK